MTITKEKACELSHKIKSYASQMSRSELIADLKAVRDYHVSVGRGQYKDLLCRVIDAYDDAGRLDDLNGGQLDGFVLYAFLLENTVCVLAKLLGLYGEEMSDEYCQEYMKALPTFFHKDDVDVTKFETTEELYVEFQKKVLEFEIEMQEMIDEVSQ